jgi:hypothetical protein
MNNAKDDNRAVLDWLADNPDWRPRRWYAQASIEVMNLIVWTTLGAIALMVVGSPFMFLLFLVIFD